MLWLKRNLFMLIGGVITLALLGVGGWYLFDKYSLNQEVNEKVNEAQSKLEQISKKEIYPSLTNITVVLAQKKEATNVMAQERKYLAPVQYEKLSDQKFATLLDETLEQMRREAQNSAVKLPGREYAFSFSAQKKRVNFAAGSVPYLTEQLLEVKAIASLLFDAKIKELTGIQRAQVSSDDGGLEDYHLLRRETNAALAAVVSPYIVTFLCFSPALAKVLESTIRSPYAMRVEAISVESLGPVLMPSAMVEPPPGVPAPAPGIAPPLGRLPFNPGPGNRPPPRAAAPVARRSLETLIDEKAFRVSLLIDVVKSTK